MKVSHIVYFNGPHDCYTFGDYLFINCCEIKVFLIVCCVLIHKPNANGSSSLLARYTGEHPLLSLTRICMSEHVFYGIYLRLTVSLHVPRGMLKLTAANHV